MSKLSARDHLFSCAIGEGNLHISRGLRSIPREWSLSDLQEKTDDELLALFGLGDATLNFIKSFLRGELQERTWKGIARQIEMYSKAYPNTFIHVHHESGEEEVMGDIHELFRKVREHPDFVGGTIFTVNDIPDGLRLPDNWEERWLTDYLIQEGNEVLVGNCVEEEGA